MEPNNSKSWVVTLTPHRSLSRQGFAAVMALIAAVNFAAGLAFYAAGAWPVAGFCGLDVLLMWWAFHANFADARRLERIEVTGTELIFSREIRGQAHPPQHFNRRWVQVELDQDRDRDMVGGLFLRSHGQRLEIGRFLAPEERLTLALALRSALA